ncbi:hypothetical protein TSMG0051 [Halocynthia phage JM-2012]|uniref:endolysin n=1 Tax=Halocynthia phage JM-2012 TaxID=1173297 RepID=UPI00025C6907|nr:endolysin [Halocynthia phage JM-2012]AFI55334.1 hypothetical protein TSMG0051 [Halocynthia phage JM-2012]
MSEVTRKSIILFYYGVEGGMVDIKDDKGGLTARGGMTKTKLDEHKASWGEYSFYGDMSNIPYELYEYIMTVDFWDKLWGDELLEIDPKLIDALYGWAINSSPYYPVKAMQKHLCVMNLKQTRYRDTAVDGGMGQHTYDTLIMYLEACKDRRPIQKLLGTIFSCQHVHYLNISYERSEERNETFTDGWFNRIMDKVERLS